MCLACSCSPLPMIWSRIVSLVVLTYWYIVDYVISIVPLVLVILVVLIYIHINSGELFWFCSSTYNADDYFLRTIRNFRQKLYDSRGDNTTTNQGVEGNVCSAKRLRIGIFPGMPVGELFWNVSCCTMYTCSIHLMWTVNVPIQPRVLRLQWFA